MASPEASGSASAPPTRFEDEERELAVTTDPKKRRQIQNRIAQRVYRQKQRKRIQELEQQAAGKKDLAHSGSEVSNTLTDEQSKYASWSPLAPAYPFADAISQRITRPQSPAEPFLAPPQEKSVEVPKAGQRAIGFHQGAACDEPLDLQFIGIRRISVNRAVLANLKILSIDPEHYALDDAASQFSEGGESDLSDIYRHTPDLAPTLLQKRVEHHPYIDVIPLRGLRNNLLMALEADALDEEELCADIERYLRVWGRVAWDAMSYEWAPEFVEKWGWILDDEAVRVSNFWRAQRGELPFVVELKGGNE